VANPIRVIYNFVNCNRSVPRNRADNGEKILLHISNFRPVKRVLDCIHILAKVRQSHSRHAWMAATDRNGDRRSAGARDRPGKTMSSSWQADHVERFDSESTTSLLLPSELEAFGLAALEGMAAVCRRSPRMPERFRNWSRMEWTGSLEAVGT